MNAPREFLKYVPCQVLVVLQTYAVKQRERVEDYMFHAKRTGDDGMAYYYKAQLDLLHAVMRDVDLASAE